MANAKMEELGLLAKVVITLGVVLIIAGVWRYGIAFETFQRVLRNLGDRPGERVSFRFILQPSMAAIAAIHDGRRDARAGRSPYFWTLLHRTQERIGRLREGLNATARIILLGIAMDVVYQVLVLKTFYPAEALIIALLLAFVPYALLRGLVTRIARRWRGGGTAPT
jgi:hypothetical protein